MKMWTLWFFGILFLINVLGAPLDEIPTLSLELQPPPLRDNRELTDSYGNQISSSYLEAEATPEGRKVVKTNNGIQFEIPSYASGIIPDQSADAQPSAPISMINKPQTQIPIYVNPTDFHNNPNIEFEIVKSREIEIKDITSKEEQLHNQPRSRALGEKINHNIAGNIDTPTIDLLPPTNDFRSRDISLQKIEKSIIATDLVPPEETSFRNKFASDSETKFIITDEIIPLSGDFQINEEYSQSNSDIPSNPDLSSKVVKSSEQLFHTNNTSLPTADDGFAVPRDKATNTFDKAVTTIPDLDPPIKIDFLPKRLSDLRDDFMSEISSNSRAPIYSTTTKNDQNNDDGVIYRGSFGGSDGILGEQTEVGTALRFNQKFGENTAHFKKLINGSKTEIPYQFILSENEKSNDYKNISHEYTQTSFKLNSSNESNAINDFILVTELLPPLVHNESIQIPVIEQTSSQYYKQGVERNNDTNRRFYKFANTTVNLPSHLETKFRKNHQLSEKTSNNYSTSIANINKLEAITIESPELDLLPPFKPDLKEITNKTFYSNNESLNKSYAGKEPDEEKIIFNMENISVKKNTETSHEYGDNSSETNFNPLEISPQIQAYNLQVNLKEVNGSEQTSLDGKAIENSNENNLMVNNRNLLKQKHVKAPQIGGIRAPIRLDDVEADLPTLNLLPPEENVFIELNSNTENAHQKQVLTVEKFNEVKKSDGIQDRKDTYQDIKTPNSDILPPILDTTTEKATDFKLLFNSSKIPEMYFSSKFENDSTSLDSIKKITPTENFKRISLELLPPYDIDPTNSNVFKETKNSSILERSDKDFKDQTKGTLWVGDIYKGGFGGPAGFLGKQTEIGSYYQNQDKNVQTSTHSPKITTKRINTKQADQTKGTLWVGDLYKGGFGGPAGFLGKQTEIGSYYQNQDKNVPTSTYSPETTTKKIYTKKPDEIYKGGFGGPPGLLGKQKEIGFYYKNETQKNSTILPVTTPNKSIILPNDVIYKGSFGGPPGVLGEQKEIGFYHTNKTIQETSTAPQKLPIDSFSTTTPINILSSTSTIFSANNKPSTIPAFDFLNTSAESIAPPSRFFTAPFLGSSNDKKNIKVDASNKTISEQPETSFAERINFDKIDEGEHLIQTPITNSLNPQTSSKPVQPSPISNPVFNSQKSTNIILSNTISKPNSAAQSTAPTISDRKNVGSSTNKISFGGAPGILGNQKPGFAVRPDGTIKDPDHEYKEQTSVVAATPVKPAIIPVNSKDKYSGGFGGAPGILIPYDN